jgi:hypothetical protein
LSWPGGSSRGRWAAQGRGLAYGDLLRNTTRVLAFIAAVIAASSGCIPDTRLILLASPTSRTCSLDEIASSPGVTTTSLPTPPPEISGIAWSVYQDTRFGYSFEYPAAYEATSSSTCALTVVNPASREGEEIYVGSAAAIFVREPQHSSWRDDACLLILDISSSAQVTHIKEVTFAGEDALALHFTAPWNPAGSQIHFTHDAFLYTIANIPNPQCDIQGTPINADAVYQHVLASFRFVAP